MTPTQKPREFCIDLEEMKAYPVDMAHADFVLFREVLPPPIDREKEIEDRIEKFLSDAYVDITPLGTAKVGMRILAEWAFAQAEGEKTDFKLDPNKIIPHGEMIEFYKKQLTDKDKLIQELCVELEKIAHWKSDARVCCFPVDIQKVLQKARAGK